MERLASGEDKILRVELQDLSGFQFEDGMDGDEFEQRIISNAFRYKTLFEDAVSRVMPPRVANPRNAFSVLTEARRQQVLARRRGNGVDIEDENDIIPLALTRDFQVVLVPPPKMKVQGLRDVRSSQIGRMTKIRGIVCCVSFLPISFCPLQNQKR